MKKTTGAITLLILGLLLAALPATATTWNTDCHAGWWNGSWISTNTGGGGVSAPSGASVGWYVYAYGSGYAYARVTASGPGVAIDQSVTNNGSNSGNQYTNAAGTVNVYLETGASVGPYGPDGGTGCGVTVAW